MGECEHEIVRVTGPNAGDWYTGQCNNHDCRVQGRGQGHPFEALKQIGGEESLWQRVAWNRYDSTKSGEKWIRMEYDALRTEITRALYGINEERAATARRIHELLTADRIAASVRSVHDQFEILGEEGFVTLSVPSADYHLRLARLTPQGVRRVLEGSAQPTPQTSVSRGEGKIFIGHGGSRVWRDLRDLIQEDLGLDWEEFKRKPAAGYTTKERLAEMLEVASFAFLVMTAEDDRPDGTVHARENVVHEIGLFQGKLGFERAIILMEEGCEEFSNIAGLTQIRFPKGDIMAKSEDVRRVLKREGLID